MKYVELNKKRTKVKLVFDEYDENFPDMPITSRYSKEYLDSCIAVDNDTEVKPGYIYNKKTNTFERPEENLSKSE